MISRKSLTLVIAAVVLAMTFALGENRENNNKTNAVAVAPAKEVLKSVPSFDAYPGSENPEYVRVAKPLLKRLAIQSVMATNGATMDFVVTPVFVATFSLNSDAVAQIIIWR